MYILAYNYDLTFNGFYAKEVNKNIPLKHIFITKDLWIYLLSIGNFKLKSIPNKKILNITDVNLFETIGDSNIGNFPIHKK